MFTTKQALLLGLGTVEAGMAGMVGVVFAMYSTLVPPLIAALTISVICGGAGLAFLLWEQGISKRLGALLVEVVLAYFLACQGGWLPGTAGFLCGLFGSLLIALLGAGILWRAEVQADREQRGWGQGW